MQNYFVESLVGLTAQLSQLYLQPGEHTGKASSEGRPIGMHSTYRLFIMGVTVPKGRALMCRFRLLTQQEGVLTIHTTCRYNLQYTDKERITVHTVYSDRKG